MKFISCFFLLACISSSLKGEESPYLIRDLVLVGKKDQVDLVKKVDKVGVRSIDLNVPGGFESLAKRLSSAFLEKELTIDRLQAIRGMIHDYYDENDRPFTAIYVPEQDVTDGRVILVVSESKLGAYKYKGNLWYSNEELGRYFDIQTGEQLSREVLLNDVSWINRNPFHYTELRALAGEEEGTTNIELVTKDRFPVRVYVGTDDTGNDYIGNGRVYTGINWGNAFGRGNVLTYQFTMNPDTKRFTSQYANWTSFLKVKHILMLSGGYTRSHPDITNFKSHGRYIQGSFRYTIPFKPLYRPFLHEFTFGLDYKNINSNLFFIGDNSPVIVSNQVNITELVLSYGLSNFSKYLELQLNLEGFLSPFRWLPHQSHGAYNRLRAGADNPFYYGRFTLGYTVKFPWNFSFAGVMRGQYASGTLLPSEEFGLGGHNTVRGYQERQFNVDNAFCVSTELRTPPTRLIPKLKDDLVFLLFCDYGIGHMHNPQPGMVATQYLVGAGGGFRYAIGRYVNARLDYGWRLKTITPDSSHSRKLYFGVVLAY